MDLEKKKKIETQVTNLKKDIMGRLSDNITEKFESAKAQELRNFLLYFSEVIFLQLLPQEQLVCWFLLVKSLRLFCHPIVTPKSLEELIRPTYCT